jgi:predicted heme/steroid binding protein
LHRLTREELARCNGGDGAPAYIAYEGTVYDITHSFLWQKGRHQVLHRAGEDLTGSLDQAPHGPDLLHRVPVVGILVEDESRDSQPLGGVGVSASSCPGPSQRAEDRRAST